MEQLLQWLPAKPQPILVRYAATLAIVAAFFALLRGVEAQSGISSFFLLYPAIFLAALLFDRGSGFLATGLSTALLIASIHAKGGDWQAYWLPLTLFFLVGLALATLTELLRKGWEKAVEAERAKDLLYRELHHRTKNDFAMAASLLNMQARSQSNADVKQALNAAVGRLLSLAKAHERLNPIIGRPAGIVPMREYLDTLCRALKEWIEPGTAISLGVDSDMIELPAEKAVPVGLIVNELVTNAYKHAFTGKDGGAIRIELRRGGSLVLLVEDDGIGCPEGAADGLGSQVVQLLVRQLNGTMERVQVEQGCRVRVDFPERIDQAEAAAKAWRRNAPPRRRPSPSMPWPMPCAMCHSTGRPASASCSRAISMASSGITSSMSPCTSRMAGALLGSFGRASALGSAPE